jgi:type I restriction enzyme, S subunit
MRLHEDSFDATGRGTWTAKDSSDLDLAVVGAARLPADTIRLLNEAFEESDLPFRVDVIDWCAVSESFRNAVAKRYEIVLAGPDVAS